MFSLAEAEISKGSKIGMEIGTIREQILIALLIYKFGTDNVEIAGINSPDFDLKLFGFPVSIKTKTGAIPKRIIRLSGSGVKLIWTVDWNKVDEFFNSYEPKSELLLVEVVWEKNGGFYYFPLETQKEIFESLGREKYIFKHRKGTNPRGVEISNLGLIELANHYRTRKIEINWQRPEKKIDPYEPFRRWIELWERD
ncbi:ThaI family type II restriction endonuclease [Candidatus Chrysopegis kryptomonas]|uniref:Restriction endonuclease ThaI n=1 Tax=Candidatus Chryseopegocella kryptomonas TaxID=1633643 RepID=A0A0P1NUK5_9BACT|nr:ThaI family type II restriction endonuclease [Candidatus Chrysopegis kryptomonas]CUT02876.1 Restriction endonuclease ThaI [Candidatus Chrysopegis kryptomonas]